MTHDEYLEQRNELLKQAQECLDKCDIENAKTIKANIEKLDSDYSQAEAMLAELAEHKANQEAMLNVAHEVPEIANHTTEMEAKNMAEVMYNATSVEYKNAWLKNLAVNAQGKFLVGQPTEAETNAYTMTTANSGNVVPTEVQNRIIELVKSYAPIYADATKSGLEKGFAIPRHKSIDAGDAAETAEGVANADEEDVFDQLALDGVEIKKHIKITKKMQFQSIDAFEDWVVDHISQRIANAKEVRILSQLSSTTYGIAAANVLTGQTCNDAMIRNIFSLIKETGAKCVYANNATIWNKLFAIEDGQNRQLFIPNNMEDPVVAGRIYGAMVKQDENIPADTIYVGVPKSLIANDFCALEMARDMDATTFVTTIAGYSLFDAGLENPLAFVKASF